MQKHITTKQKTVTAAIALATLLSATAVCAGRATGVSSVGKSDPVAEPAAVAVATNSSSSAAAIPVRIAKLEAEILVLRTSLNKLTTQMANKPY